MKRLTSYQRRLRDIEYLHQCIEELEDRCIYLWKTRPSTLLPLDNGGLKGDKFITPYNNGDFTWRLMTTPKLEP